MEALAAAAGTASSDAIVCARVDLPLRRLFSALPPEPWPLPVVDGAGRFLGFISREQLRSSKLPWRMATARTADFVVGASLAVREAETLRVALQRMVRQRARVVALVDDAGIIRGVLRDIERRASILPQGLLQVCLSQETECDRSVGVGRELVRAPNSSEEPGLWCERCQLRHLSDGDRERSCLRGE
jgi:hypothetical protein